MTSSHYTIEIHDGFAEVRLLPTLNDSPWDGIEQVGNEVLEQLEQLAEPRLLVDLSQMEYMGSAVVALLVRLWKAVNARGGRMVVVNTHDMVYEVLRLAGLTKIWTIVADRDQAIAALKSARAEGRGGSLALMNVVGVIAALIAAVGVYLQRNPRGDLTPRTAFYVALGGGVVGLACGLLAAVRQHGAARIVGIALVVVTLGLGAAAAIYVPPF